MPDATEILHTPETEFVIAGDSHIFAMGASQAYVGPISLMAVDVPRCQGYFLMARWQGGRGPTYWDALVPLSRGRIVVLVVMGNQHFAHYLLARKPFFDFVDPTEPGHVLYPGAVVMPRRMVKALPMFDTRWVRDLVQRLRAGGCREVIVVGTPPVRSDFGAARENIIKDPFWRKRASSMGIDIASCGFTPAPIMKRLWGVLQESLADVAGETRARFLSVPGEAIDEHGFRKAEYCGPLWNFAHANDAYGRLVLEHIVRAVGRVADEASAPVS